MSDARTMGTWLFYQQAFEAECRAVYPMVDALERAAGVALDPGRYLPAARVLACPLKIHAPNWQHGRVLYALARARFATVEAGESILAIDIGTAKGYSALCLQWALADAEMDLIGTVVSVDVIDPGARVNRNTIVDLEGERTLPEILTPWPEAAKIQFLQSSGRAWLTGSTGRVAIAFVDGKHDYAEVSWEANLLTLRQSTGDVILFDDLQIAGVRQAVSELRGYDVTEIRILPHRRYAIATKVGL